MSRTLQLSLAIFAVALAVALAAFWPRERHSRGTTEPLAPATRADERAPDAALAGSRERERESEAAAPMRAEPVAQSQEQPSATADERSHEPDLDARTTLTIRVVDALGLPVEDAEVTIRGLRSESEPGSWHSYPGNEPVGRTSFDGRVGLEHVVWVDIDGRTCRVDLAVEHPDFVPFDDHSFAIGPGEHEVVLERGATVVVSGWVGSPDVVVSDVVIELEREAGLGADAWERTPQGTLATTRLAPGAHMIRLEHRSEEHGHRFSAVTTFELAEADWKELRLELVGAERLAGELDPAVPRPIARGRVMLDLHEGGLASNEPTLARRFEAEVASDGSFVVEGLPPGSGQIIALSDGWVSRRTLADSFDASAEAEPRDVDFVPQRVDVPQSTTPFLVAMHRTGSVEVTVRAEDGTPLANAYVGASPNVHFEGVGAIIFPWREWHAATDASGVARIDDLEPTDALWIGAQHATHRMNAADRARYPAVAIRAGETTRVTLTLEPDE